MGPALTELSHATLAWTTDDGSRWVTAIVKVAYALHRDRLATLVPARPVEGLELLPCKPYAEVLAQGVVRRTSAHRVVAKVTNVRAKGSRSREADLSGADLRGADLRGASFEDARLDRANLRAANLHGANLTGATCEGAELEGALLTDTIPRRL